MDDKTLLTTFAVKEVQRINDTIKDIINHPESLTDEQKNAVIKDIETTLWRLQSALSHIEEEMLRPEGEKHDRPS